ncbi:hypothetical protein NDU88_007377 [Pleurodeles waltl]|uniref:Uncharacterized protein n=1 Tax=Pleurodeles waltl TaxID=8319 RepID=A0AAV7QPL4_PLEWA|nr:hypothetical protein NDU88_007377 [Pleurodeles waltl]
MEEVDVGDHQDDLERMLAQMRAEALRRGNDWLRAKMEERTPEGDAQQVSDLNPTTMEYAGDPGPDFDPTHKASKWQRAEGKLAKKVAKKPRGANRPTSAPATVEAPENSSLWKPTEDENISAIIKECLKSFAPLLLKGSGSGWSQGSAKKGRSQESPNKGEGSGPQEAGSEWPAAGDPMPAWVLGGKDQDTVRCEVGCEQRKVNCEWQRNGKVIYFGEGQEVWSPARELCRMEPALEACPSARTCGDDLTELRIVPVAVLRDRAPPDSCHTIEAKTAGGALLP